LKTIKKFPEFTQKKTGKIMTVPMHRKVLEMLQKKGKGCFRIRFQTKTITSKMFAKLLSLLKWFGETSKTLPKSGKFEKESGSYRKCDLVTSHIGRRSCYKFYGTIPTSLIGVTDREQEAMYFILYR
jgi:hypothetical protein